MHHRQLVDVETARVRRRGATLLNSNTPVVSFRSVLERWAHSQAANSWVSLGLRCSETVGVFVGFSRVRATPVTQERSNIRRLLKILCIVSRSRFIGFPLIKSGYQPITSAMSRISDQLTRLNRDGYTFSSHSRRLPAPVRSALRSAGRWRQVVLVLRTVGVYPKLDGDGARPYTWRLLDGKSPSASVLGSNGRPQVGNRRCERMGEEVSRTARLGSASQLYLPSWLHPASPPRVPDPVGHVGLLGRRARPVGQLHDH